MKRRPFLMWGCAHCALLAASAARAQSTPPVAWTQPPRFTAPDPGSDEGGLWAQMAREEQRLRRGASVIRDPQLDAYLKAVSCRVVGDHCEDLRVYAVRTPLFNAVMAPNGMMQIWSGLLLRVENEAQLATIVGHEAGHYLQRHSVERLRDAKSRSAAMTFFAAFGLVGALAQLLAVAGLYSYSRDQEREADRVGLLLMQRAGYDTREAPKVWDNLLAELKARAGSDPEKDSVLFATHPGIAERRDALVQMAQPGGEVGDAALREALKPVQPMLLADELARGQYDQTIALLDRLVEREPQRADLRYTRGEARRLRADGTDVNLALDDFNQAIALAEPPPAVYRSLGLVYRDQRQREAAVQSFTRYLELAPDAADAGMIKSYLEEMPS